MTPAYKHIFLSPHYDDAALSCGGAIHQLIQTGQPALVITVCAAPPNPADPLSPFAEALHSAWGNPTDTVATRRKEDQLSMEILGADYRHLSFTDCIYRGDPQRKTWYYTSDPDLFGEIHPADMPLAQHMAAAIGDMVPPTRETVIYAPLTVGHHVDHQLTRTAAGLLQAQGWNVVFYEDYPYCDPEFPFTKMIGEGHRYILAATLTATQAVLQPQLRPLSTKDLQAKVDSIRAYASQLPMLFGGEAAMEQRVRAYALHVGQGSPAERIWLTA